MCVMLMPFTGKISILASHSQTAFLTNVIEVLCFGRFLTCVQHSIMMYYSSGMGSSSSIGVKAVIFRRVETNLEVSATVFQWINGPAGICLVLSLSDIWVKCNILVMACFYKQQFTWSWQEGELAQSHLSFFLMPPRKARKQCYGAAVSLAEKLLWLWVGRKSHRRRRRELHRVNHQCCIFFNSKEFTEALPLPEPFYVMVCLLFS